jgi:hypothetical protein
VNFENSGEMKVPKISKREQIFGKKKEFDVYAMSLEEKHNEVHCLQPFLKL